MRLIWSYSESDPEDENQVLYHGTKTRGTRSVYLSGQQSEKPDEINDPETRIWEVRANNFTIPHDVDTRYSCRLHKAPEVDDKHHILGVEFTCFIVQGIQNLKLL